uniref:Uncharacterized protein n=1 Tax=Panagrolaimus davidi TaxID=227884 RepID=A0A914PS36_9BILA
MNASNGGYASLSHWSSCSLEYLEKSLKRKMDYCLHNVPKTAFGGAKCGNGIVEEGEDCDCGNTTVCPNKCCVASTCKLAKEAICASGDCCDISTCQPKKKASVCRPEISSCDLPEFCDGITGDCPADFFVQNGLKCPDAPEDFCYEGECGSRTAQCQMIWGPTGADSIKACYNYNLQKNIYGNCGYDPGTGIYTPCTKENLLCGRLHCQSDNDKPIFGDASTVTAAYNHFRLSDGKDVACRVIQTTYTGGRKKHDPGMVQDGAACGKDKLCIDSKCTNKTGVRDFAPKCDPQNCNTKGICNSAGNCHCVYGYGGTSCDLPGYGGSVNSGPSTDQAFNALLWTGVVLAFICILFCGATWYCKKRKNKWLPKEMWHYTKEALNIRSMLVPVRKAPPPPGGRHAATRHDPNSVWGDNPNQLRVGAGRPVVPPPLVTIPNFNQPSLPNYNDPDVSFFSQPPPITSVTSSPSVNPVKHNRSGRRAQAPGFPAPKPPETKALNPSSRQPGDSSSDENTLTSPDIPPPVPPHRDLSSNSLPAKKEKPKLPVKPPVATKPVSTTTNVNVKNLAAKFDVKNSNVNLG